MEGEHDDGEPDLRRAAPLGTLGGVAAVLAGIAEPTDPVDGDRTVDLVYTVDLDGDPDRTRPVSVERFWHLQLFADLEPHAYTSRPELVQGTSLAGRGDSERPCLQVAVREKADRDPLRTAVNGVPVVCEWREPTERKLK